MQDKVFINSFLKYLTENRNISLVHSKKIAYFSLRYANRNMVSNYLVSCWEDLGIEELCANISLHIVVDGKKESIESFKNNVPYLTDYLHYKYASYKDVPNILFSDEVNHILDNVDDNNLIYKRILELSPSMDIIINRAKTVIPAKHNEIKALVIASKNDNKYAKNRLFDLYLNSLLKQSLYFSERYDLPYEECFQNAGVGFVLAIDKYDFSNGYNFGNYYGLWVKQQILRNMSGFWRFRKVPVHMLEKLLPLYEYFKRNDIDFGDIYELPENYYYEVSHEIGLSVSECKKLSSILVYDESYEHLTEDEEEICCCFVDHECKYTDQVHQLILNEHLKDILHTLNDKESQVIKLRFGLLDGSPCTLEDVSSKFEVTRERIRQIENTALRKLGHPSRKNKLIGYLDE